MGARARIKKLIQILEKLLPTAFTVAEIEILPTYLNYLIRLNDETVNFRFTPAEIQHIEQVRDALKQWTTEGGKLRQQGFSSTERHDVAKVLMELRYLLADKIQHSLRETSFIVLERDALPAEPLVWPQEIVVVLDHLRSPFNVGAIVRTMECVGLNKLVCIGYTPRLDSRQVQRSAMGCEAAMTVEYAPDAVSAINALHSRGFRIYILETIQPSQSVFHLAPVVQHHDNIALIVGNEEFGVDESILPLADHLIHIPTFGKKNSLNVSIAFSIAIYQFWSTLLT